MTERKHLLITVPTAVAGSMHVDLMAWLMNIQLQSFCRRMGDILAEGSENFGDRVRCREAGESFGTMWAREFLSYLWVDEEHVPGLAANILPDNWDVFVTHCGAYPVASNRNQAVRRFLWRLNYKERELYEPPKELQYDALLMIDDDIVPDPAHLHHLCAALDSDKVDIVSGVYCMDTPDGPQPVVYDHREGRKNMANDALIGDDDLIQLANPSALPGGFIAVKRYVYLEMLKQDRIWFKDCFRDGSIEAYEIAGLMADYGGDPDKFTREVKAFARRRSAEDFTMQEAGNWKMGEDIWFCLQAQAAGFRLSVDRRMHLKHYAKRTELRRQFRMNELAVDKGFVAGLEAGRDPEMKDLDPGDAFAAIMRKHMEAQIAEQKALEQAKKTVPEEALAGGQS